MTPAQAVSLADAILAGVGNMNPGCDILVCPPFTALSAVNTRLTGSPVQLGAQNMHPETSGAFTGECSADMLIAVGCNYVLCGHSERRHVFGESDAFVNRKVLKALSSGLKPIFCVGETEEDRDNNLTFNVVERQLRLGLKGIPDFDTGNLVLAYEPVWAIGTGKTASPEQAQEVHDFIRNLLTRLYPSGGRDIRILYGGSVKPDNVEILMAQPDINGALVGGASLKADSFLSLIRAGK